MVERLRESRGAGISKRHAGNMPNAGRALPAAARGYLRLVVTVS